MRRVCVCLCALAVAHVWGGDVLSEVNPFIGTSWNGHCFPAAALPFGLVQSGPDTGRNSWDYCSGYRFEDEAIYGFSHTHLNGTGCPDLGDIRLLPFCGSQPPEKARVDKAREKASPGYYATMLKDEDVAVEIAASGHAAIYRLRFAKGGAKVLVDATWGIGYLTPGKFGYVFTRDAQYRTEGGVSIIGSHLRDGWVKGRKVAYHITFSRPWTGIEELEHRDQHSAPRYLVEFGDVSNGELLIKVGFSTTTQEKATDNLAAEIPDWDFNRVKSAAEAKWRELLGRVKIDADANTKKNFYTSLYHLFLQPNNQADVGAKPFYSTFSLWDTFRAAHPLYTILVPEKIPDMVDSLLEQGRSTGYLPIWTLGGIENQCMIGTHSVPVIVDAYLKGLGPTDAAYWEAAYAQIRSTLRENHIGRWKDRWDLIDRYGYYPFDIIRGESVARLLECAYDDWCAGVLAQKLGHAEDARYFFKRAGSWRHVFDAKLGFVRGRDSKGNWREPFNPYALGTGAGRANDFTEGNSFQYTWHVMHDVEGLIAAMGGREKFVARLDSLFTATSEGAGQGKVLDVTGLIGQYVHGNEPSHHVIYFYPQLGHPEKAAARIREVFRRFYLPKTDGLCGNDDCGQMSAWYVFSALGFYPFNPCGGEYVIGEPQVDRAVVDFSYGHKFEIRRKFLPGDFAKRIFINGKQRSDWRILHDEISAGGELTFH